MPFQLKYLQTIRTKENELNPIQQHGFALPLQFNVYLHAEAAKVN